MADAFRKAAMGLGSIACLATGLSKEAEGQMFISPELYGIRKLHYGQLHDSYYKAVSTRDEHDESRPVFEMGYMNDRREDLELPVWFYGYYGISWIPENYPIYVEARTHIGDYASDARPRWMLGYCPENDVEDSNFHWQVGIEGMWDQVKGIKAYTTTILRRAAGDQFFIDFNPAIGRKLVSVKGDPRLINEVTYDLQSNIGYTTKKGRSFAASLNIDEGRVRNASIGYGWKGMSLRCGLNEDKRPFAAFNMRRKIPKDGKRSFR